MAIKPRMMVMTRMYGLPYSRPIACGSQVAWLIAMTAEHMASIEPTERSICRATITKTMPQAMMATGTACTEMLKTLRGLTKVPPVQMVKTTAIAAKAKNLSKVESEVFAFQTAVDSDQELQFALGNNAASDDAKIALVNSLLKGKATEEASVLIRRAVTGARRRRVAVALEQFGKQVSAYAERLVATVTVAAPVSDKQLERLEAVLAKSYGHSLKLNVEVDESILGGMKVQVGGEILDGSLSARLLQAKLQLA